MVSKKPTKLIVTAVSWGLVVAALVLGLKFAVNPSYVASFAGPTLVGAVLLRMPKLAKVVLASVGAPGFLILGVLLQLAVGMVVQALHRLGLA